MLRVTDLPTLSRLSHDEKDALIRALWAQVQTLTAQVQILTAGGGTGSQARRAAEDAGQFVRATVAGQEG